MAAELRLRDLMKREQSAGRLMNVKVPAYLSDAIDGIAGETGASKTEVVIALLNEGLAASQPTIRSWGEKKLARGRKS